MGLTNSFYHLRNRGYSPVDSPITDKKINYFLTLCAWMKRQS